MADLDAILDGLRVAYARIGEVEAVAAANPGDVYVLASLESVKQDAIQLEAEWLEQCRVKQIDVCRYKLQSLSRGYSAASFAKSLLEFQELFSQIFDAKKNGVKQRARVSGETLSETTFGFAYSYPGSLGVALTIQNEVNLFEGKFAGAVAAFNEITSIDNEDDVRVAATVLGDAVIKKIYDWSNVNYRAGFSVDVVWMSAQGRQSGKFIERDSLGRIVDLIDKTKDIEVQTFRVSGTLVAIDTIKKRFRFVVPDGEDYAGPVSDAFDISRKWAVNTTYVATIRVVAITKYSTQQTDQTHTLEGLEDEKV